MSTEFGWWIPAEEGGHEREYFWPYLNRELSIRLLYGGDQVSRQLSRIESGKYGLVVVDSSVKKFEFLKYFPPRSIVVFSASDETYSLRQTAKILKAQSVAFVMREYPVRTKVRLDLINQIFKLIPLAKQNKLLAKLLISVVSGITMYFKQLGILIIAGVFQKKFIHCPLGYTGKFATAYDSFKKEDPNKSIIEAVVVTSDSIQKTQTLFFAGQRGSSERQLMLSQAEESGYGPFEIFDYFGGPAEFNANSLGGSDYVQGLSESKFSLCPPGNYSAETFRFLESLLLFSYPLRPSAVLSDPSFINKLKFSWNDFLEYSKFQLNDLDLIPLIIDELANFEGQLSKVRSVLSSYRREL